MKILMTVCGSVAAYKTFDIVRGLVNDGHSVKVILTSGGEKFVNPQLFRYLGAQEVYTSMDDFKYPPLNSHTNTASTVLHIELGNWCDKMVFAPLTANTISKMCRGEASDLATSVFLALPTDKPLLLFPAMNNNMLKHPFTQENIEKLQRLTQTFFHPTTKGVLACGVMGEGKLPAVEKVITAITTVDPLQTRDKKVLITTGATLSPLDPVRYITNPSSGITGYYLAKKALEEGHHVVVVAGLYATNKLDLLIDLPGYQLERVATVDQMKSVVDQHFSSSDLFISAAAIGDIEFDCADSKLKKEDLNKHLLIKRSTDILASVLKRKSEDQQVVGFAAETELTTDVLKEKLKRKPVDLLIGTQVHNGLSPGREREGFQSDKAHYAIMDSHQKVVVKDLSKKELSNEIFNRIQL